MQTATFSVEFSFNNILHRQIDGVAMGSSLGPSLANIFVGYYEALLFKRVNKPLMYYRYVDDTFAVFTDEDECNEFFSHLNSFYSFIKATLFINFGATAIVGTWVVRLKGYNRGLSSTCRKPFSRSILLRTEAHWPAPASQS